MHRIFVDVFQSCIHFIEINIRLTDLCLVITIMIAFLPGSVDTWALRGKTYILPNSYFEKTLKVNSIDNYSEFLFTVQDSKAHTLTSKIITTQQFKNGMIYLMQDKVNKNYIKCKYVNNTTIAVTGAE